MSLWEFAACMDGLNEFHGGKRASRDISEAELAAMGVVGFEDDG